MCDSVFIPMHHIQGFFKYQVPSIESETFSKVVVGLVLVVVIVMAGVKLEN